VPELLPLKHPWLVAVWPGMGHVAVNAGIYLLSKLGMTAVAEVEAVNLFDIEQVDVKDGIVQLGRRPRNRLFVWKDPDEKRDLVVFVGEAQPPVGKYQFCKQLVTYAQEYGVERVFTFAAMATRMHPEHESRVFAAATDEHNLGEMRELELEILENGQIGGLNGLLLGAASEADLHGACLLGEMPHILAQFPFPKASLAILEVFQKITGIDFDLSELAEQVLAFQDQLGEVLARIEEQSEVDDDDDEDEVDEEGYVTEAEEEEKVSAPDRDRIEELFDRAEKDRSKAFELKGELDQLGLFKEYEDRFLDLFDRPH